jgi:ubiquinone/menaquinone biosynthesis C-methylase UbiE
MEPFWPRVVEPSGQVGPDYWTYFAERLAHLAAIPRGAAVLDIGTYDGNVLFKAVETAGALGRGVGIDIDSDGFRDGVAEAMRQGWEKDIAFVHMDANALGFLSETFDSVLANFVGWDDCFDFDRMAFIGSNRAISEIARVLKLGGQVGIGSWVEQSDIDWVVEAFERHLPEYGEGVSCYAREHPAGQRAILQSGGFEDIRVYVETTDFVSPDEENWWRQMAHAVRPCLRRVSDPAALESFKEQVVADLQQVQHPEGIRFSKTVSFAFGTRPG